ncbi:diacylglycerol kinase [Campylobacter canadensis]|uniref:Diacylglycerol kinase n=1 Tax=Campylobacter canadensis TaxID=449520 RepID=A0ABS7WRF7_9BACT|nr:diacylglycerol kinase [Campylobacter canadensis]MBZ7987345.1 diacylglycerol kinase [Campylobacter canadensis]MBZ7994772.1 diacylglycerol kinase [Campylobacter canadensis]MBZ7996520.1 diacylglycerol kinase [Campylobacter canadensis]MBZ7998484.1 diacylglycerol kinase [Campylobacter canadensis]MBZ8000198.1 diacylglycerol kinase [Campylobacter canadensis]
MKAKYSFFKNTSYALAGLKRAWQESAFRIEFCIILPLVLFAFFYDFNFYDRLFLISVLILILIVECINTAIECAIDLITKDYALLAKYAKDLASAGVFFSIVLAVFVWVMILSKEFL